MTYKNLVKTTLSSLLFITLATTQANAEVGELLWQEEFNELDLETWNINIGDGCDEGLCGWGNAELQWYGENNVTIEEIPGEAGNNALVFEARDEASNGYSFTSGKVDSHNNIAVQYGMIEVRVQIPDVGVGLWPAAWLLGTSTQSWPAKGEIDMMEMGQSESQRESAGYPNVDINSYVGSNLIFYADEACSDGNPSCAASLAFENDNAYLADTPLTNRFVIYRTYWTESEINFTVEDRGVETSLYSTPFTISDVSDEFRAPFYLLLNLAVGGTFTDALTADQVTAAKPAKMLIDYVRVYEYDGQGEVLIGNQTVAETGTFGVFTDETPTDNKLIAGSTSDIYVWNTASVVDGTLTPSEGDNVLAWNYITPNEWFGGGINTRQATDMSSFADTGTVSFDIKIPADVPFRIGIEDTYSNQNWIEFPANTTAYGLERNGEWGTATIPVADLRGTLIALQSLQGMFYLSSIEGAFPTESFEMAIDNIIWDDGKEATEPTEPEPEPEAETDSDSDGVLDSVDSCADTEAGAQVDETGCEIIDDILDELGGSMPLNLLFLFGVVFGFSRLKRNRNV